MRPPALRSSITPAFVAVATSLLVVSPHALLVMLPALVLAWVVAIGWFTGERAIALVRRIVRRLRRPAGRRPHRPCRHAPPAAAVRGGLLLACSLASRPPPAIAMS